jgi:hypothetical protein
LQQEHLRSRTPSLISRRRNRSDWIGYSLDR